MKPIVLDIVANIPSGPSCCCACSTFFKNSGVEDGVNKEILKEYPEGMIDDHTRLSSWISEISALYEGSVMIRIIEAISIVGLYKAVRHSLRAYPAFIVDKKLVVSGWDRKSLREALDERLRKIPGRR